METSEIKNLTQIIVDAKQQLQDCYTESGGSVSDAYGSQLYEILGERESVDAINDGIERVEELLNEAMDAIDSIVDSIDD